MILTVTGYGSTGASAYVDLLKEFSGVQYFDTEFSALVVVDGLLDLREAICSGSRLKVQTALLRFKNNIYNKRMKGINDATGNKYFQLTEEYFYKVANVVWNGSCVDDPVDLMPWYKKKNYKLFREIYKVFLPLLGKNKKTAFLQPRYFSTLQDVEFDLVTKQYLQDVFVAAKFDLQNPILLEQVFDLAKPLQGMSFFANKVCSFVVDRDPRDVYLLTNVIFPELNKYMPCDKNVKNFVAYYRSVHKQKVNDSRVKYVHYEDLIYDYKNSVNQVVDWLPALQHIAKGKYFKPEYSVNNTQLWKQYPQYNEDIAYIERELKDMLYDFDGKMNNLNFKHVIVQPFENQQDVE
ncbi:MAG: hypothetical protein MJ032_02770 [Acidaminococcaceae bacterium]|nr:hypothetical protein [Acidaminococcaceae bacterium]